MATPRKLVECVAEALNLPIPTVIQFDRVLAEAGLRAKAGRGHSAAKVQPTDAANLLIAILGSPVSGAAVKVAATTCRSFGRLPVTLGGDTETLKKFKRFGLATLSQLPAQHTLRDAVSEIISAASQGESLVIPDDENDPIVGPRTDSFVGIRLDGPRPWAELMADASLGELKSTDQYARLVYHAEKSGTTKHSSTAQSSGDLHQSRQITFRTIRKIGNLLAERDQ